VWDTMVELRLLKTFLSLKIFSRRDASVQFRMGFGINPIYG
jgi:hypothetical protein